MFRFTLVIALLLSMVILPALADYEYALDDGAGNWAIGPSEWDAEILWGNCFDVMPGYETIDSISVSFGPDVPLGREFSVVLFEDPTDDLDPTDAIPLSVASSVTVESEPNEFITIDIDDAVVSGTFFVASTIALAQHEHAPRMDPDTQAGRSWLFFDSVIDINDLGGSPLYYNMANTPFNGTWMVRAQAIPEPATAGCLLTMFALMARRKRL